MIEQRAWKIGDLPSPRMYMLYKVRGFMIVFKMDFNQCFLSYDDLDGANCQTVLPERMTQREAAVEAVRKIGLRQVREIDLSIFGSMKKEEEMFCKRLSELKRNIL